MQILAHQLLDLIGESLLTTEAESFARTDVLRKLSRLRRDIEGLQHQVELPSRVQPTEDFFDDLAKPSEPEAEKESASAAPSPRAKGKKPTTKKEV